jgi:hypothetical protein
MNVRTRSIFEVEKLFSIKGLFDVLLLPHKMYPIKCV